MPVHGAHHGAWYCAVLACPVWLKVSLLEMLPRIKGELSPSPGVSHGAGREMIFSNYFGWCWSGLDRLGVDCFLSADASGCSCWSVSWGELAQVSSVPDCQSSGAKGHHFVLSVDSVCLHHHPALVPAFRMITEEVLEQDIVPFL